MGKLYQKYYWIIWIKNLFLNLTKSNSWKICKTDYKSKHKFLQKRARSIYIQRYFHSCINRKESENLFAAVKHLSDKERYLNLKELENRQFESLLESSLLALISGTIKSKKDKSVNFVTKDK